MSNVEDVVSLLTGLSTNLPFPPNRPNTREFLARGCIYTGHWSQVLHGMTRRKRATRVFVQHLQTCSTISTISYVADKKTDKIRVFECFSRVLSSAVSSKKSCPIFLYMHRINKITLFKLKMQIAVVNESKIREVLEKNSYHYTNIILFDFPSHYISPIIPRLLINFNFQIQS